MLPIQRSMSAPTPHPSFRSLDPRGRVQVERIGIKRSPLRDLYLSLLVLPWHRLIMLLLLVYLLVNTIFACLFILGGDCIAHVRPGNFADYFFFSIQTFSTIGYGDMAPKTLYAHVLVASEAFCGILCVALITGLLFAKFSRPHARIVFSNKLVVDQRGEKPLLTIRMANHRSSHIVEGQLRLTLLRDERDQFGEPFRRFYDLPLQRQWTPLFALSWTAFHTIDESSPLHGQNLHDLQARGVEIIATFVGIDEVFNQSVHARTAYGADQILFNTHFENIIEDDNNRRIVNYHRFHNTVPHVHDR